MNGAFRRVNRLRHELYSCPRWRIAARGRRSDGLIHEADISIKLSAERRVHSFYPPPRKKCADGGQQGTGLIGSGKEVLIVIMLDFSNTGVIPAMLSEPLYSCPRWRVVLMHEVQFMPQAIHAP